MRTKHARGNKFDPDAEYMEAATGFERAQLKAMAKIIEAKVEELRGLREERLRLANRVSERRMARVRAEKMMGPRPKRKTRG